MITISFQQIANHIQSAIDAGREDLDIESFTDLDADDTILAQLEYFLSEACEPTFAELADRGLKVDHDEKLIHVRDADAMTKAYRLTAEIMAEYDATRDRDDLPTHWWSELSLGGDDDVDYNGGYLDIVFDIVADMLPDDHKPKPDPIDDSLYNLPADVIDARLAVYKAQFYKDYPEALVRDTLRAKVHELVKKVLPNAGLCLTNTEFQLYHADTIYRAPRANNGPWIFTAEGCEQIRIDE